jgi:hypothetical protein
LEFEWSEGDAAYRRELRAFLDAGLPRNWSEISVHGPPHAPPPYSFLLSNLTSFYPLPIYLLLSFLLQLILSFSSCLLSIIFFISPYSLYFNLPSYPFSYIHLPPPPPLFLVLS